MARVREAMEEEYARAGAGVDDVELEPVDLDLDGGVRR
jgi:hypothetical protein